MIPGLALGFAQPLVLLGLISLPALWLLLRLIPPRPRRIDFPPTRLLFDIAPKEETPARTPWWLTLLRLTLAALAILAAAGPQWNPPIATAQRSAPLAILLDDAFTAAASWDLRLRAAEELVARAEQDNRGVAVVALSQTQPEIAMETPGAARVRLKAIQPKPYAIERADALGPIARFLAAAPDVELIWLSDGADLGTASRFVTGLARLVGQRRITVVDGGLAPARALTAADNAAGAL
ncbi:MAG: BatA domain-containing protein, partial [Proteobacteria bacterium]|nr:BatA domain-containing protein [Pseudomonadota bacterium]